MIEIITTPVQMPPINERRYRYTANMGNINSYWYVYDTMNNNIIVGKGRFEEMQFKCHYLNKNYYNQNESDKENQNI